MAKSKFVEINEKIAEKVVSGYKKIEESAVGGFNKMADGFVDSFLTKEGESVEEARERLAAEQKEREVTGAAEMEKRAQAQSDIVERSLKNAENASKEARRKAGLE